MADLDLPRCGQCGYDLTGLPTMGQCPECGNRYNFATGQGLRPEHAPPDWLAWLGRYLAVVVLTLMALAVLACGGCLSIGAANPARPLTTGGLVAGGLLAFAIALFFIKRREAR